MPLDPNIILQSQVPQSQNPLEQYGRALALKNAMGQGQLQQQEIQKNQMELQGQKVLDHVMQTAFTKDADGNLTVNRDAVTKGLSDAGQGHRIPGVLKGFNELDEAAAKLKKTQIEGRTAADDYTAQGLLTIADHKFDPSIALGVLAHAAENGVLPAEQARQMAGQISANPSAQAVQGLIEPLLSKSPAYQKLADSQKTANAAVDSAAARKTTATTGASRETREAGKQAFSDTVAALTATPPKTPQEYRQRLGALPTEQAMRIMEALPIGQYDPATATATLRKLAMTPEQQTQADQAAANTTETSRHNKVTEATAAAAHALQAKKFSMEFGGDAVKGWSKTLEDNPDAAASVPAALRSAVQQQFSKDTGLPYPKPVTGGALDQERAARNALDGIDFIQNALKNPEIAKQLGPIMGRLGDASQRVGTAVGLSPQAEKLAQELRTRMKYFVFQEGKAVLGGKLPQQLMNQLEGSSANVNMDPNMLAGALDGAQGNAESVIDNVDKQRFGGQSRKRAARPGVGIPPEAEAALQEGHDTTFGNGQVWTKRGGKAVQVK